MIEPVDIIQPQDNPHVECKYCNKYEQNFDVHFWPQTETFHKFLRDLHNDLTQASIDTAPEIKNILSVLTELDNQLLVRLTGSGGTCFALFDGIKNAQEAAEKLKIKFPGWWIEPASILT